MISVVLLLVYCIVGDDIGVLREQASWCLDVLHLHRCHQRLSQEVELQLDSVLQSVSFATAGGGVFQKQKQN